ncbi:MAG TPA: sodium:solute symporter, partial [Phaeodactylibacter sp.]|nr:sodium:solute symporter [Phaeodactylibacter sp.]
FISIPGVVGAGGGNQAFSYMQMVFGYLVGYAIIALVLLPLYYRMNLTSIYGYLEERFGVWSYKTGAFYFLLSRVIGASFRLFLVGIVLHQITEKFEMGIPFWAVVAMTILLIWVYTFKGGIKTIVWTDTLQTTFMLTAVVLTIIAIGNALGKNVGELVTTIQQSDYSQMFFFDNFMSDSNNFWKQFISGALIATVMTGLDQDMMQKNLSCRTLGESQKNIFTFSVVLVFVNMLFLGLGALLYIYATTVGIEIPERTDQLFATIALDHLSPMVGIVFILGLIAAAYSSADSALTALTTSFCVDFLGLEKNEKSEDENKQTRFVVHIGFSILLFSVIILSYYFSESAVINNLFTFAGYTYGPLLGLFSFGLFSKSKIHDGWIVPVICVVAPIITYVLTVNDLFIGFKLGFLNIALNGLLTFLGLLAISYWEPKMEGDLEDVLDS